MTLAASFKEYYSRPTTGAVGNNNVNGFNAAMNFETTSREAAQAFNNADGFAHYLSGKEKGQSYRQPLFVRRPSSHYMGVKLGILNDDDNHLLCRVRQGGGGWFSKSEGVQVMHAS
jgi:hypothetical protein